MSPEEIAKEEAEKEAFSKRCRPVFEQLRPSIPSECGHIFDWLDDI